MTEDEAKAKWCPFARVRFSDKGAAANIFPNWPSADLAAACIASECMAWRWGLRAFVMVPTANLQLTTEPERPAGVPADWEWHPYQSDGLAGWCGPRQGFCGLAGDPRA